jgi:hypothetical protein
VLRESKWKAIPMPSTRALGWTLVVGLSGLLIAAAAAAEDPLGPPSGKLRIESTSVAAGIGVSWGKGVLTVDGQDHSFSVSGLSVADVGVSTLTATGEVWGLDELSKFDGTYYGVDVGVAVGGGGAGLAMRNENGVFIKLRAAQQGVKLSLASKGTKLELE